MHLILTQNSLIYVCLLYLFPYTKLLFQDSNLHLVRTETSKQSVLPMRVLM